MQTVKELISILNLMPDDATYHVYEGEMVGIVIEDSGGKEIAYIHDEGYWNRKGLEWVKK